MSVVITETIDTRALPPGPGGPRPLVAARFMLQAGSFIEQCGRRFGDAYTIEMTKGRIVVISSDPEVARRVFTGDPDHFLAGAGNVVLRPLLGPRSILLLDGPEHLRQRRLMLPPFHGERMRAYGDLMAEIAERHVAGWPVGRPFAVHASMQAITFEVILRAVFGIDDADRLAKVGEPLRRLLDSTGQPGRLLLLQLTSSEKGGPRSPWGRVRAMMAPADAMLLEEIHARRAQAAGDEPDRQDILSLLLAARDEDGQPLTDAELRDELMTLLVAGHETTATAAAWTLERIVRHPEVLARLREEQEAGGHEYLDAVIKETLRLRPVVPAVVRKLTQPLDVGSWTLPVGVHVAPSIFLIHRRPDLYPEPEAFRPERFLGKAPGTYEWLPFGGGIRRCLGASFALYELRIVLGTILRMAELETTAEAGERIARRFVTFTPARGGRVRVTRLDRARERVAA